MTLYEYTARQEGWNGTDFSNYEAILAANPGMTFDVFAAALTAHSAAYDATQQAGFQPSGKSFRLALAKYDRDMFTAHITLLQLGLGAGQLTAESATFIADIAGAIHNVTVGEYIAMMLEYGAHVTELYLAGQLPN